MSRHFKYPYFLHSSIGVFATLLLLAIFLRFPYLSISTINWDESTYILMGQSLLEGNLPYTQIWELKPPLAFLPYAFFIGIFGKSIEAIRIGAIILVTFSSYFIFLAAKELWDRATGLLAGLICVTFLSVDYSGQALMTETIAVLPLSIVAFLLTKKTTPTNIFWIGLVISIATLVRLNLAYTVLIMGFFILYTMWRKNSKLPLLESFNYGLGGAIPLIIITSTYVFANELEILKISLIDLPLAYSHGGTSVLKLSLKVVELFLKAPLIWIASLWSMYLIFRRETPQNPTGSHAIFALSILVSILMSGHLWKHYLLQLVPIASIFAAYYFTYHAPWNSRKFTTAVILILCYNLKPIAVEYFKVINGNQTDLGRSLATTITEENLNNRPVYLMTHHIAYWLANVPAIKSDAIHPSVVAKTNLTSILSGSEKTVVTSLKDILLQKPEIIAKETPVKFLANNPDAETYLNETIKANYQKIAEIDGINVYKIKPY